MGAQTRKATCMLCEAMCGLAIELEGDEVRRIRGDREDPFSRGHICPKATAIPDVQRDPDRVREPLRRVGDRWEPMGWDAALSEIGERIAKLQRTHGRDAVALYAGNPTVHSHGALLAATFLSRALGTRSRFSATSVDQLPQMLASLQLFGHQLLLPVPDVDRTQHLMILGANPVVSNGSLMTAPGIADRIAAIRARGGSVVVIDPRRTETAAIADRHVFIRPGGDAFLLLAMLHVIFAEGLARPGRLEGFTHGLDALRAIAARFPPERVAARSGIDADTTRTLARELATRAPAVVYGRLGTCVQEHGALAAWLVVALNVVTGNLDREGGAMFTTPAVDIVEITRLGGESGHFDRWRSRVRGLPEFGGELPVATLADELETEGPGRIRAMITFAGNPVLSTPNGARLERALRDLELMVAIDLYKNETTRHAHFILPTSFGLERDHYDIAFNALAVRNVAKLVPALVAPPPGVRHDFDVMLDLARALRRAGGGRRDVANDLAIAAMRKLGSRRTLDLLLRSGPHGLRSRAKLSVDALLARPEGIDLGPLEPVLPRRLVTASRRIELVPALYAQAIDGLERALDAPAREALVLIGRRHLRSNNSWLHNSARLVKGRPACTLVMSPEDAGARGLGEGERVVVRSRVASIEVPLVVSAEIAPGVVSLPHGWGHGREGAELRVAAAHAGASINDLTDELRVDAVSGNAAFSGLPVEVERAN